MSMEDKPTSTQYQMGNRKDGKGCRKRSSVSDEDARSGKFVQVESPSREEPLHSSLGNQSLDGPYPALHSSSSNCGLDEGCRQLLAETFSMYQEEGPSCEIASATSLTPLFNNGTRGDTSTDLSRITIQASVQAAQLEPISDSCKEGRSTWTPPNGQFQQLSTGPFPIFPFPTVTCAPDRATMSRALPVCQEELPLPCQERHNVFSLAIDEDYNWLTEFQCLARTNVIEIFRASERDSTTRRNISHGQVGIRCRWCAHLPVADQEAGRACSFPTSTNLLYQSFNMMVRDHFKWCAAIPLPLRRKLQKLKDESNQGANYAKKYWIYAAKVSGLIDSSEGIIISDTSIAERSSLPPFGVEVVDAPDAQNVVSTEPLVYPEERGMVSQLEYLALSEALQAIRLTETERQGHSRRNLTPSFPGLGCRFCAAKERLGFCRTFPPRERLLKVRIQQELCQHLQRCPLCPVDIKASLLSLMGDLSVEHQQMTERKFYARLWKRIGHQANQNHKVSRR